MLTLPPNIFINDFEIHTCSIPLKGCQTIEVTEIYDGSYKDKKLMNGMGIDGTLYTFEIVPRKAIPLMEPLSKRKVTDPYHEDENKREGNRTEKDVRWGKI